MYLQFSCIDYRLLGMQSVLSTLYLKITFCFSFLMQGGLDETLSSIIALCQENQVHLVFALKRQRLGKVLLKKVPVSIVGIFNYNGADVCKLCKVLKSCIIQTANINVYYINTSEIPSELSRENFISSHVK